MGPSTLTGMGRQTRTPLLIFVKAILAPTHVIKTDPF